MASNHRAVIGRDEVVSALARVCADAAFVRAPQLRRLLEYLVASALDNKPHLKAYTIAVEALGRAAHFDPEQDAIVRVQARRLRGALDAYYAAEGRHDELRIVLASGNYIPTFERREPTFHPPSPPRLRRHHAALAVAIVALMLAGLTLLGFRDRDLFVPAPSPGATGAVPSSNGFPVIVILPYDGPGMPGLRRSIAAAFARFEAVNVIYMPDNEPGRAPSAERRPVAGERVYALTTTLVPDKDGADILFQLVDRTDGTVVWAQRFDAPAGDDAGAGHNKIVGALATILVRPYGVIASRERAYHLRTGAGDPRYRCILEAAEVLRDARDDRYAGARACLEQVIAGDPSYALAHAYLASILSRIFQFGLPGEPGVLDQALAAARRAVQADPASARAHFALFVTRFNMREFDAADEAMARARALNEYDLVIRTVYGGRLITGGRIDEGMAILDEVDAAFSARACTHGFYTFLGDYLRNNRRAAHRSAGELTCPSYPLAFIAKALAHATSGDGETAKQEIARLYARWSFWRTDPRAALRRLIPNDDIVERILRDLAVAGLEAATPPI